MKKIAMTIFAASLGLFPISVESSLYNLQQSPYATFIAQEVGDILTVIVSETATTADNGDAELKRDSSFTATLKKFFLPPFSVDKGFSTTIGTGTEPGIDFSSASNYKANAKNSANHAFDTRLQVRILEKIREGEFVIRGTRTININGKNKNIFVSGVIRQRDILADNTVKSEKIADATIEIEGEVAQKDLEQSVFSKAYNWIF